MYKNDNFYNSLKNAVSGYRVALECERNLRFHTAMALSIICFAIFFEINRIEWAILIFTVCFVITTELLNSGIEKAVDTATNKWCDIAGRAKDFAAAATLVSAIAALSVGICLFLNVQKIIGVFDKIFSNVYYLIFWILILIIDVLILIVPGKKRKKI